MAFWILRGQEIPLYRVAEGVLAVPILCAAAVVAVPRLAGDRRWIGVAIGVMVALASVTISLRLADAAWRDESSIMDPVTSAEVGAAVTYLDTVPVDIPIIFVVSATGFTAQNQPGVYFGLGQAVSIVSLEITWPDGTVQDVAPPELDTRITVTR